MIRPVPETRPVSAVRLDVIDAFTRRRASLRQAVPAERMPAPEAEAVGSPACGVVTFGGGAARSIMRAAVRRTASRFDELWAGRLQAVAEGSCRHTLGSSTFVDLRVSQVSAGAWSLLVVVARTHPC